MESKGRRAPRATAPIAAPAEPAEPVEVRAATAAPAEPPSEALRESPGEPPQPAEILAEAVKTAETAIDLATAAVPTPPLSAPAPATESTSASPEGLPDFGRDALAALAQSQAALAQGMGALSTEIAGLALSAIDTAARTATKMLGVKTLSDAIEVNAGFTCSSLDTLVGAFAKLSELGAKLAAETTQPLVSQLGKGWIKAARRAP